MSYDAPEFWTSSSGYSPDQHYINSKRPDGESQWVDLRRCRMPEEVVARIEEYVHCHSWCKTLQDFVRDAVVHHLQRMFLIDKDPHWHELAEAFGRLFDVEKLAVEDQAMREAQDRWNQMIPNERDPVRRDRLIRRAREHLDEMPYGYWHDQLEELVKRFG